MQPLANARWMHDDRSVPSRIPASTLVRSFARPTPSFFLVSSKVAYTTTVKRKGDAREERGGGGEDSTIPLSRNVDRYLRAVTAPWMFAEPIVCSRLNQ